MRTPHGTIIQGADVVPKPSKIILAAWWPFWRYAVGYTDSGVGLPFWTLRRANRFFEFCIGSSPRGTVTLYKRIRGGKVVELRQYWPSQQTWD